MKIRMGAAKTTPLWSIGRRVKHRVGISACNVPVREHQASGVRRESEPVVAHLGSSSLVGGKTRKPAVTAPEK